MRFSSVSMLLRQRSNCTGISSQEARVTRRSCWVRWTTRLIIYPMSHRWNKMVNSDGANSKRKRQRQTTSSLAGRQLLPVIVEIPAGSILFFSALMHAGYGIWSLDEMLIRPVPSMDDMMQTSISDLLIRYQAHVARPKQYNSFRSIDPTKTVRGLQPAVRSILLPLQPSSTTHTFVPTRLHSQ